VTIQIKAFEQHFPVVLLIIVYQLVLIFEFVDEFLKRDHSNENYCAVLLRGAVYCIVEAFFYTYIQISCKVVFILMLAIDIRKV